MSKRKLLTFLLLTALSFSVADRAEAQFLKKLFGKGKHHKNKTEAATTNTKTEETNPEDNRESTNAPKETKKERKKRLKKERKEQKDKELKEKKEKREKEKQNKKKKGKKNKNAAQPAPAEVSVVRKWADMEYPASQRKTHYRVDILAPLYLDELVRNGYVVKDIPEKAIAGLNFYKGVQIAADSLKKAGFDVDIYIHDVASLLESTDMLINKNALDSADLIIGAVNAKDVPALAAYAKRKKINFISTLSAADGDVKDNQYFTLLTPTLRSHCEWINNTLETKLQGRKALLMYRTSVQADDNAAKCLMGNASAAVQYSLVLSNSLPKKEELAKYIDTAHTNVVVVPVLDNNYADSLLRILNVNFPRARFEVYGMPGWNTMANIRKGNIYNNMTINITTPYNFDPTSESGRYVESAFAKEYGGKPQEFVYRGYEVTFWYVNLLKRHGTIFNKQYDDVVTSPFTKFDIRPQWDEKGNVLYHENRSLFVNTYGSGTAKTGSR